MKLATMNHIRELLENDVKSKERGYKMLTDHRKTQNPDDNPEQYAFLTYRCNSIHDRWMEAVRALEDFNNQDW